MSRDELGGAPGAGPPHLGGPRLPDDLEVGSRAGGTPPTDGAPGTPVRRRRARGALALLVAGLVGASAAGLALRGEDDERPPLTLLLSWGDGSPRDGEDEVVVDLVLANSGEEDLVVTSAGTGGPSRRLAGELEPSRIGRVRSGTGEDAATGSEVVVPGLGSASLGLRLPVSCTDPPPWRPWVEVRRPSTATEVVDLRVLDDLLGSGDDALVDACTTSSRMLLTPAVVGQAAAADGLVLQVRNDTDVPYRVEVVDGGAAGLSLADEGARLLPAATTDVTLRVDPDDCRAALDAPDLLADVTVSAVRAADGQGPARTLLVLDPFLAGAQVGIGVGRACSGTPGAP